jgi:two-component system response regulator YesN
MYGVLIVDDEPLILAGVISLINWEEYQCKIVGKATNGQQAFHLMEELKPDIVITDIKMPAMDGIELLSECKKAGYSSKFIILTNLEEFGLARQAISLGAIDYLVKIELDSDIFAEAIHKAIKACKKDEQFIETSTILRTEMPKEEVTKRFFQKKLIYEDTMEPTIDKQMQQQIEEKYKKCMVIMIHLSRQESSYSSALQQDDFKRMMNYAESILVEMVKRFFTECCLLNWDINKFLLVVSLEDIDKAKDTILGLYEKVQTVLLDYFEMSAVFAVSHKIDGIPNIQEGIYQVTNAMNYYYFDSNRSIIFYSNDLEIAEKHNNNFNINFLKKDIAEAIHQNNSDEFRKILEQVVSIFKEYKLRKEQAINGCINLYYFISSFYENESNTLEATFPYAMDVMGKLNRISSLQDIIKWLSNFTESVCNVLDIRRQSKEITKADVMIDMVKKYIEEHVNERLTLGHVANKMGISQGYLSSIFKKLSGSNFSDYVSEIKIEKSKEYISTHQYMIYEVSDILGFDNAYYFSKVFKKVTGMTPREFEKTLLNK